MAEHYYKPEEILPAEGRSDVAGDLEEEQRNAYSAHHARPSSQGEKATLKTQQQQKGEDQPPRAPVIDDCPPYPVEGRCDVAEDLEEEQRNAYSTHHARPSA
jgi:hypothetical protein